MKKIILTLVAIVAVGTATTVFANPVGLFSNNEGKQLTEKFQKLTRDNVWEKKEEIDLQFNAYHPQGMTKVGDIYYMSSVEIIEKTVKYDQPVDGYDRTPGKGIGHLFVFNKEGKLLKDIKLGSGDIYHPGGIAFDGTSIWVPVAEYRPDSESIIYKVDPETLQAKKVFQTDDHIGGIVRDEKKGTLKAVNWGSRTFYEYNEKGKTLTKSYNPSHFIDYQDCESAGNDHMICGGITELPQAEPSSSKFELGGLALLDMKTMEMTHELPVSLYSSQGHVATRNPVFLENTNQGIKMYAVPDDDSSSLLIYETSTE